MDEQSIFQLLSASVSVDDDQETEIGNSSYNSQSLCFVYGKLEMGVSRDISM